MSFNFVKLPELDFELKSETLSSGRYYATPKGKYASITTVLSHFGNKKALQEWRNRVGEKEAAKITQKASSRGTAMHTVCEDLLNGKVDSFYMANLIPHIKENAKFDLYYKLKEFKKKNPKFGRKRIILIDKISETGTIHKFHKNEFYDKYICLKNNKNENFLENHLTFIQEINNNNSESETISENND